jgi:hypothetical protein
MRARIKAIVKQDFCTYAPDKIFGVDLSDCCERHDIRYEAIRRIKETFPSSMTLNNILRLKKNADIRLRKCIAQKAWWLYPIAWIYYFGVRAFGMTRERLGMER